MVIIVHSLFIGDLASIFGCLVGLKDTVTAITFVALGTSLPDLFASRTAAVQEKFADNAIGNVTGSNSVNVFLGLGLPWLLAAFYWSSKGEVFRVSKTVRCRYIYIYISFKTELLLLLILFLLLLSREFPGGSRNAGFQRRNILRRGHLLYRAVLG